MRRTEDEVVLSDLAIADFLRERVWAIIDLCEEPSVRQSLIDLQGVFSLYPRHKYQPRLSFNEEQRTDERIGNRYHEHLTRRKPEWPGIKGQ